MAVGGRIFSSLLNIMCETGCLCSVGGPRSISISMTLGSSEIQNGQLDFSCGSAGKESACNEGFISCVGKISLKKGKTTHSSILAWRVPWTV